MMPYNEINKIEFVTTSIYNHNQFLCISGFFVIDRIQIQISKKKYKVSVSFMTNDDARQYNHYRL